MCIRLPRIYRKFAKGTASRYESEPEAEVLRKNGMF